MAAIPIMSVDALSAASSLNQLSSNLPDTSGMSDGAVMTRGDVACDVGMTLDDADVTTDDIGMTFGDATADVDVTPDDSSWNANATSVSAVDMTLEDDSSMMSHDPDMTHGCLACIDEATLGVNEASNDGVRVGAPVTYGTVVDTLSVVIARPRY